MGVRFSSATREEVVEAARYYESEVEGLGRAFLEKLRDSVADIKAFPEASRIIDGDFRRHLLARFPYGVVYRVESGTIFVAAVMHLRRRPDYWKKQGANQSVLDNVANAPQVRRSLPSFAQVELSSNAPAITLR